MREELLAGLVPHRVAMATWYNAHKQFVFPATWTDGFTPGGPLEGGVIQLDPALDLSQFGLSDPLGSYLYGRLHVGFATLILINAGSTLAVLLFLPFLPAALLARREGAIAPGA